MHHPGGIKDEVPGHRRHLLAPVGTVFDRHPAAENVDVGVAFSVVVPAARESGVGPHPAHPAILMLQELSAVHAGRGWPGWRGLLTGPDHDRSSLVHWCSPRWLVWAPGPTSARRQDRGPVLVRNATPLARPLLGFIRRPSVQYFSEEGNQVRVTPSGCGSSPPARIKGQAAPPRLNRGTAVSRLFVHSCSTAARTGVTAAPQEAVPGADAGPTA